MPRVESSQLPIGSAADGFDWTAWRARAASDSRAPLLALLQRVASARLGDPLPPARVAESLAQPHSLVSLDDEFALRKHMDTLYAGASMHYYLPLLALSYHLYGDERYAQRALDWLDCALNWPRWDSEGRDRGDIQAAYVVIGTVLAANWLGCQVMGGERADSLHTAWSREGQALMRWLDVLDENNHNWASKAALGLLLATHPECFTRADELLQVIIDSFRRCVPLTFGETGEYNDGLWYGLYSVNAAAVFATALEQRNGVRLFDHPNLQAFGHFVVDTMAPDGGNYPDENDAIPRGEWLIARPVLAWLARMYDDPTLQSHAVATLPWTEEWQRGVHPYFVPDYRSPRPEASYYQWGVYDLLWFDLALPSATLPEQVTFSARRFPASGICVARDGQWGDHTYLHFRAGSASVKDLGDHNGFVWFPFGRRVFDKPRSSLVDYYERPVTYFKNWSAFFGHSRSANVILVDGQGQRPPDAGYTGQAWGWQQEGQRQWRNRDRAATTSRIVGERIDADSVRWTGAAEDAYPGQLKTWHRTMEWMPSANRQHHVELHIHDHIETRIPSARIEWLLHATGQWKMDDELPWVLHDGVKVRASFLSPGYPEFIIQADPPGQHGTITTCLQAGATTMNGVLEFDVILHAERLI